MPARRGRRRRLPLVVLVAGFLVVASVVFQRASPPEPQYRGTPLTVWLRAWSRVPPRGAAPSVVQEHFRTQQEAEEAIRALAPVSVPHLSRMVRQRDAELKTRILQSTWARRFATNSLFENYLEPSWKINRAAALALSFAGAEAREAVPALIESLESSPHAMASYTAAYCLGTIGPDAAAAIPVLTRVSILASDQSLRNCARDALRRMGPVRTNGLAVALPYEHDPDPAIQTAAAVTLGIVDPGRVYGSRQSDRPN